jgi:periplasmic divalent cation tolerance protein
MTGADKPILIYATFPTLRVAQAICCDLVEQRLAACVNLIPGMQSIYRWEGKIETGEEVVGLIKTRAVLADAVIAHVKAAHPYDNPALLVLDIAGGSAPFLDWILAETKDASAAG